jgi:hypothetical protein
MSELHKPRAVPGLVRNERSIRPSRVVFAQKLVSDERIRIGADHSPAINHIAGLHLDARTADPFLARRLRIDRGAAILLA